MIYFKCFVFLDCQHFSNEIVLSVVEISEIFGVDLMLSSLIYSRLFFASCILFSISTAMSQKLKQRPDPVCAYVKYSKTYY